MEKFDDVKNILWDMTVDRLKDQCKFINRSARGNKADIIDKVMEIYTDDFVISTYKELNDLERELLNNFIQQKANPLEDTVLEIKNKYSDMETTYLYNRFFIYDRYDGNKIAQSIYDELVKIVPKREYSFSEENPNELDDYYGYIVDRASRISDFDYFVKYVNANKIKPTSKSKLLAKKDFTKIHNELKYMEVDRDDDIKTIEDTSVSYGIYKLLSTGNVIDDSKEYFKLGIYGDDFARFNKLEKVKFLFDKYINASSIYINEISRIRTALIKTEMIPNLVDARIYLVDILKKLPINKWVKGEQYKRTVRMDNCDFLRDHLSTCLVRDDYTNAYDSWPSFNELEESFIDIFLIEYLAVLGIVDVVVNHITCGYWDQRDTNIVEYLRLTEFGAMVLGLVKEDNIDEEDLGFTVDDSFNIKILDGSNKMKYELYFERFLDKNSNGTYKLDFIGICRALDLGIDLADIIDYIGIYGNNNSRFVMETLNIWLENSKKIKIRTVNIVEFPKELEHLFYDNDNIEKVKNNYLIVKKGKISKLKSDIEKKGVYCKDESK